VLAGVGVQRREALVGDHAVGYTGPAPRLLLAVLYGAVASKKNS